MATTGEITLKILLMVIHLTIITITAIVILFSEDLYILLCLLIIEFIVFTGLIVNNGCQLSKYELVGGNFSSTTLGKKLFWLSDNIEHSDFEKMFVGVPLGLLLLKTILVAFPFLPAKKLVNNFGVYKKYQL
jgi:hypothetical protein